MRSRATSGRLGRARRTPGHFRGCELADRPRQRARALLPGLPNGQERVTSLESLDQFAASTKQITPPGTPAVMVTKLQEVKERGGTILAVTSNLPLVVRGLVRFWPRDVDHSRRRPEAILRLARPVALLGQGPGPQASAGRSFGNRRGDGWSGIRPLRHYRSLEPGTAGLEQFPGVKLIPFGWVAFFIFLYILLIGPGDYFFLKKVLKRMELTWITFPTIVLTVSLVAYYAAYVLKGNDLLVNKIDVVDIDQEAGITRGNTWISFFSPQNRDYSMHAIPTPLDAKDTPAAATGSGGDTARRRRERRW